MIHKVPLSFWYDHFLYSRTKILLLENLRHQSHSENNWTLRPTKYVLKYIFVSSKSIKRKFFLNTNVMFQNLTLVSPFSAFRCSSCLTIRFAKSASLTGGNSATFLFKLYRCQSVFLKQYSIYFVIHSADG